MHGLAAFGNEHDASTHNATKATMETGTDILNRSSGQEVEIAINKIGEVISEMTNALITLPRLNYSTNFYPPYIIRTQIFSSFQWNVPKKSKKYVTVHFYSICKHSYF